MVIKNTLDNGLRKDLSKRILYTREAKINENFDIKLYYY